MRRRRSGVEALSEQGRFDFAAPWPDSPQAKLTRSGDCTRLDLLGEGKSELGIAAALHLRWPFEFRRAAVKRTKRMMR